MGIDFEEQIITEGILTKVRRTGSNRAPNTRAVLFVHGFTGNARDTWTDPKYFNRDPEITALLSSKHPSFPSLLCCDETLSDFDIFVFSYRTTWSRPPAIENISRQLEAVIDQQLPQYHIAMIAHSMGGLVCMDYIVHRLRMGKPLSVIGLMLFGTPMSGVEWIRYARTVGFGAGMKVPIVGSFTRMLFANKQLRALERDSEFLERLFGEWILRTVNGGYFGIDPRQRVWIPVRVVTGNDDWVVSEASAKGVYGEIDWLNVDRDHRSLVKPRSVEDVVYQHAAYFLRRCREWKPPEVLKKLREQVDWMWTQHSGKLIRQWRFDFQVTTDESLPDGSFGLRGFNRFAVKSCRYLTLLTGNKVLFGFALGKITTQRLWSNDFVYLHRFLVEALDDAIRSHITNVVATTLNSPDVGWNIVFRNVSVRIRIPGDNEWLVLLPDTPERHGDGMVCSYKLPEGANTLVGNEIELDVAFESIMPADICDFAVDFPWLCDGFNIQFAVQGSPRYLVVSPFMTGSTIVDIAREDLGAIRRASIVSEDLAMPRSKVVLEWQRAPRI